MRQQTYIQSNIVNITIVLIVTIIAIMIIGLSSKPICMFKSKKWHQQQQTAQYKQKIPFSTDEWRARNGKNGKSDLRNEWSFVWTKLD